jgi:hypothetical protein
VSSVTTRPSGWRIGKWRIRNSLNAREVVSTVPDEHGLDHRFGGQGGVAGLEQRRPSQFRIGQTDAYFESSSLLAIAK